MNHRIWTRQGGLAAFVVLLLAAGLAPGGAAADVPSTLRQTTPQSQTAAPSVHHNEPLSIREYDLGPLLRSLSERPEAWGGHDAFTIAPLLQPLAESLVRVQPDAVTLRATAGDHRRIAELLQLWQQTGLRQISIEVRFVTASRTLLDAIPLTNSRLRTAPPADAAVRPPARFDRPLTLPGRTAAELITSSVVTRQQVPVVLETLDAAQAKRLLQHVQDDARANVMQAPKVALFHGQSAQITDITQRPFVVGIATSGETRQPQIQVLDEGTRIHCRGVVSEDSQMVRLECQVQLSQIDDVETQELTFGGDEPLTVQNPHWHSQTIAFAADLAPGQSVLVGAPQSERSQKSNKAGVMAKLGFHRTDLASQQMYLLISARVLEP